MHLTSAASAAGTEPDSSNAGQAKVAWIAGSASVIPDKAQVQVTSADFAPRVRSSTTRHA